MKKLTYIIFATLITFNCFSANQHLQHPSPSFVECTPTLQHLWSLIQKLPEARTLIAAIQREGSLRITSSSASLAQQFGAFWDPDQRVICVNTAPHKTQGDIIGSIIFELHNAFTSSKLDHLDHLASLGHISQEKYVESVEHLEYINSLNASKMAKQGIQLGLFPQDAQLMTYDSFEEHYRMQKIGGHSAWIARTYKQLRTSSNNR
jgi:hypothetical protein